MVIALILPGFVMAESDSGTDVIEKDYLTAHSLSFLYGDSITITYTVNVTLGPNIDVFVVDSENYLKMSKDEHFEYYGDYSKVNTTHTNQTMTFTDFNTYYLVLDNTIFETYPSKNMVYNSSTVKWTLNWDIEESESGNVCSSVMLLTMSIILIGLISMIHILRR